MRVGRGRTTTIHRSSPVGILTSHRRGDPAAIIRQFANAAFRAVANGGTLVNDLRRIRDDWRGTVNARSDSAVWRLADLLIHRPVVNARVVADELGIKVGNVHRYVKILARSRLDKDIERCFGRVGGVLALRHRPRATRPGGAGVAVSELGAQNPLVSRTSPDAPSRLASRSPAMSRCPSIAAAGDSGRGRREALSSRNRAHDGRIESALA